MTAATSSAVATGLLLSVCVARRAVHVDGVGESGIGKMPTDDSVVVGPEGIEGDMICDRKHHGGIDQAVYAYSDVEARRWADELGRPLPPGWFGENMRVDGVDTTDAVVGERWHVGDTVVLEVTVPRTPCRTFAAWSDEADWLKRFLARSDVGAYLRVVRGGRFRVGDPVTVVERPDHGVRVRSLLTGDADPDGLRALVDDPRYAGKVARDAGKVLRRALRG